MDDTHDDNFLMTRIATGSPGRMPAFGQSLQIEDIQAIIVYIRNLKP
jgi:mono/diheme cytochrome c family protein